MEPPVNPSMESSLRRRKSSRMVRKSLQKIKEYRHRSDESIESVEARSPDPRKGSKAGTPGSTSQTNIGPESTLNQQPPPPSPASGRPPPAPPSPTRIPPTERPVTQATQSKPKPRTETNPKISIASTTGSQSIRVKPPSKIDEKKLRELLIVKSDTSLDDDKHGILKNTGGPPTKIKRVGIQEGIREEQRRQRQAGRKAHQDVPIDHEDSRFELEEMKRNLKSLQNMSKSKSKKQLSISAYRSMREARKMQQKSTAHLKSVVGSKYPIQVTRDSLQTPSKIEPIINPRGTITKDVQSLYKTASLSPVSSAASEVSEPIAYTMPSALLDHPEAELNPQAFSFIKNQILYSGPEHYLDE